MATIAKAFGRLGPKRGPTPLDGLRLLALTPICVSPTGFHPSGRIRQGNLGGRRISSLSRTVALPLAQDEESGCHPTTFCALDKQNRPFLQDQEDSHE
jgi:hypothetical protein